MENLRACQVDGPPILAQSQVLDMPIAKETWELAKSGAHNSNQETRSLIILLRTVVTFMARPLLSGGVEGNSTNQKDDDENYLEGGGPHV